jgi:hypothetical protein
MTSYRNTALSSTPVDIATARTGGLNISGFNIINQNSVDVYIKLYDSLATNVTVGTTTPIETLMVPANGSIAEFHSEDSVVATFQVAASIACVTGLADSSITAPTSPIYVSIKHS